MNAREFSNLLASLLRNEQSAMADFLMALAEFDREKLWRDLGHGSLFSFLRFELRLSAGAAQYRKTAAELIQVYPEVEAALRGGRLCLSTIVELAKVITPENVFEVLPRFEGLSRRDAEMLVASIKPVRDAPERTVVTTIRSATRTAGLELVSREERAISSAAGPAPDMARSAAVRPAEAGGFATLETDAAESRSGGHVSAASRDADDYGSGHLEDDKASGFTTCVPAGHIGNGESRQLDDRGSESADGGAHGHTGNADGRPGRIESGQAVRWPSIRTVTSVERAGAASRPPAPDTVDPLDAERNRIHVTVSHRFLEKLDSAKAALSHAKPGASAAEVLEAGLDLLLAKYAKTKGLSTKPREATRPSKPGTIPAHVKRAAMRRSGGRCEWRFASGERCNSKVRLEFDHVIPVALGGDASIENIRCLCREHNQLAARLAFGDGCMDRYARKGRKHQPSRNVRPTSSPVPNGSATPGASSSGSPRRPLSARSLAPRATARPPERTQASAQTRTGTQASAQPQTLTQVSGRAAGTEANCGAGAGTDASWPASAVTEVGVGSAAGTEKALGPPSVSLTRSGR